MPSLGCVLRDRYYYLQELIIYAILEKVETVKEIIDNLARNVRATRSGDKEESDWQSLPIERFLRKDNSSKLVCKFDDSRL